MSVLRDDELELAAGYALGTLDEADRQLVETLIASGHAELERVIAELREATTLIAHAAPAAVPSADLRARVLAAARAERVEPQLEPSAGPESEPDVGRVIAFEPRRRSWVEAWSGGFAAAAAALALVAAFMWMTQQRTRAEIRQMRADITQLRDQLDTERRWESVLSAPWAQTVRLSPTTAGGPPLSARATYDPRSRRAVLVFERFSAPAGHDYELWAIRPDGPESLGLIKADENGRATLRLEDVGDAATLSAFAVSLENAGGAPTSRAPGGPVVMVGKLSG